MQITLNIPTDDMIKMGSYKKNLETLAKNVTPDNLEFLAQLSEKPNINAKLEKNKNSIKMFL